MVVWSSHIWRANPGPERWNNGRASGVPKGHALVAHSSVSWGSVSALGSLCPVGDTCCKHGSGTMRWCIFPPVLKPGCCDARVSSSVSHLGLQICIWQLWRELMVGRWVWISFFLAQEGDLCHESCLQPFYWYNLKTAATTTHPPPHSVTYHQTLFTPSLSINPF